MLNWIVCNRTIFIKMGLALNNLQSLICHKNQTTNKPSSNSVVSSISSNYTVSSFLSKLYGFKYSYLILKTLKQLYVIKRWNPNKYLESGSEWARVYGNERIPYTLHISRTWVLSPNEVYIITETPFFSGRMVSYLWKGCIQNPLTRLEYLEMN